MHELTMAQAIVKSVLRVGKKEKARKITKVSIEIGELMFHTKEQLKFWLKEGFKGTIASKAKLSIKVVKAQVLCRSCLYKGRFRVEDSSAHYSVFQCPKCKSTETDITAGKEYVVKDIEIVR